MNDSESESLQKPSLFNGLIAAIGDKWIEAVEDAKDRSVQNRFLRVRIFGRSRRIVWTWIAISKCRDSILSI
jgi:hypothetical protein